MGEIKSWNGDEMFCHKKCFTHIWGQGKYQAKRGQKKEGSCISPQTAETAEIGGRMGRNKSPNMTDNYNLFGRDSCTLLWTAFIRFCLTCCLSKKQARARIDYKMYNFYLAILSPIYFGSRPNAFLISNYFLLSSYCVLFKTKWFMWVFFATYR
jgi:hypothetical protein